MTATTSKERAFQIIRGGNRTTEQVIGATTHRGVNEYVTSCRFPLWQGPEEKRELIAFLLEYDPSPEDLKREFKTRGLEEPTYEDALKFDEASKSEKGVFVFPHKPWLFDSHARVLVVDCTDVHHRIDLGYTIEKWSHHNWFVGVKPCK